MTFAAVLQHRAKPTCCDPRTPSTRFTPSAFRADAAFGLEAASGVARELESRGIGLPVGPTQVPIVCSSCIFDLAFGDPTVRPDIEAGIAAVREALDNTPTTLEQGNVGAGTVPP